MQAQIITDRQQWNDFVSASVYCNVTQTFEWGEILPVHEDDILRFGVVDAEGKLRATILMIITYISPLKIRYFYAPRGPIIDDPAGPAMDILLKFIQIQAKQHHAFMLKLEPGAPDEDVEWLAALTNYGFVRNPTARHLRHEWILDIRPDEQTLLAGMKKTWRYCVRQASRKGVKIYHGNTAAELDVFYNLLHTTSERDSFFVYEKTFYERVLDLYGDHARLLIAEYEGEPLAAALLVSQGRWCWYMYGASSNEHRDRMPNHLLQWNAFQWAKQQGCWFYNFRGIPDVLEEGQPMWGIYVFKSGFGGQAMRFLATHDLAYMPLVYQTYRRLLDARHWYDKHSTQRRIMRAEQKKSAIKQAHKQQNISVQTAQHEHIEDISIKQVTHKIDTEITRSSLR